MMRRDLIAMLGAAAAWPRAARAQPSAGISRVAVLHAFSESDPEARSRAAVFEAELKARGWIAARNLQLEYRWTGADPARIAEAASEIVRLEPDAIFTVSSLTLAPLRQRTSTIPIVFAGIADPVELGFVASLAHLGGNITGFVLAETSMYGKGLQILKEAAPGLARVAVLLNPEQTTQPRMLRAVEDAARPIDVRLVSISVRDSIERAVVAFAEEPDGGLVVLPNPVALENRDQIASLAVRYRLPAVYFLRPYVTSGGLMSYGPDLADQYRGAASYVDRILRGEKPADLPVQQPTKFELLVNLKTAKAIGLTIPQSIFVRADEVIE
jgi:putative ABC transport system substrate-binding protein